MTHLPADDGIEAFTRGDTARAAMLRDNLTRMAENTTDPEVRRLIREVLDGRRTLRQATREPAFVAELDRGMQTFARAWEELTPEQRAELVRQGQAQEAQRRADLGLPPPVEPPAEVDHNPALRREL